MNRLREWWGEKRHVCQTPDPRTFAPIAGREWSCPECGGRWIYEARDVEYEVQPAVWDRWAETATESVVAWWRVEATDG